jgi:hypothetical protein
MMMAVSLGAAQASVPDWVLEAAKKTVQASNYDDETDAVVLLDEEVDDVQADGQITEHHRRAVRILRPQGRDYATLPVYMNSNNKVSYLRAYGVSSKGLALEAKEKDAVERIMSDGFSVYDDTRVKTITAPEGDPGSTVAFEWE